MIRKKTLCLDSFNPLLDLQITSYLLQVFLQFRHHESWCGCFTPLPFPQLLFLNFCFRRSRNWRRSWFIWNNKHKKRTRNWWMSFLSSEQWDPLGRLNGSFYFSVRNKLGQQTVTGFGTRILHEKRTWKTVLTWQLSHDSLVLFRIIGGIFYSIWNSNRNQLGNGEARDTAKMLNFYSANQ